MTPTQITATLFSVMNNKPSLQIGQTFAFTYEKLDGELRRYRIIVDRINADVFSGRCLKTGRILNNLRLASVIKF